MKYVIAVNDQTGYYVPVLFSEEVTHAYIGKALQRQRLTLMSAGFCYIREGSWVVNMNEKSESMKLGPRSTDDLILNLAFKQGLAGLDLYNMMTFLAIPG